MRYEDEQDPKQPRPVSIRRKHESTLEAEEHGLRKVGPDGKHGGRYHHMHVRC